MTIKQRFLFEYVRQLILSTGRSPSFSEMREYMKVSSNQAILDLLTGIEKQGYLQRKKSIHRGIELTPPGQNYSLSKVGEMKRGEIEAQKTCIKKPNLSTTSLGTVPVYVDTNLISNVIQPFSKGGDTDGSS